MPHSQIPEYRPTPARVYQSDSHNPRIEPVLRLAEICSYQAEHAQHVTRLALRLFDELQPLHRLGSEERFWLEAGAILHDIGWIEGWRSHHKTSLRVILSTPMLPFNNKERHVIGSIARYHCKALPSPDHDHYAALLPAERGMVSTLAALLRLADGLDSTHRGLVKDLACDVTPANVTIKCKVHKPAREDRMTALEKADLFEQVFGRKVLVKWHVKK
jgi:exopolyphosphatase/guanosine-5'-triphosphate,3'-diphosphate pyrophosphatase